jgi:hypothetical protein
MRILKFKFYFVIFVLLRQRSRQTLWLNLRVPNSLCTQRLRGEKYPNLPFERPESTLIEAVLRAILEPSTIWLNGARPTQRAAVVLDG